MHQSHDMNGLQIDRVTAESGKTELRLCPQSMISQLKSRRSQITERPEFRSSQLVTSVPDSMVQIKLESDHSTGGFVAGMTMQDSLTVDHLVLDADSSTQSASHTITVFRDPRNGLKIEQHLESTAVEGTLRSWTQIENCGDAPVSLEYLTSFVLSGITAFTDDDAPETLKVHRFRSWWSNEGRLVTESTEDLHLERSWAGFNLVSERFGQVGTMPVRKFFPFVAIEDCEHGVLWGAQLAWAGSWQMEVTRRADAFSISGGLADYEFGHWKKTLAPGESLSTPVAHLACIQGTLSDLTAKLVRLQESQLSEPPASEHELPVIFNEWCTNWGSPSHDKTIALAKRLQGLGIRYLVIDDGWAIRPPEATMQSNGDWIVDTEKFPKGMAAVCQELREMGFTPGIWFEFEVCNPDAKAFQLSEHHLHRNGTPLRVGARRFWNLNDPWVKEYLNEKLIRFLKENQLGYLKVDYNDTIGIGCDHADSFGEGLRTQVNGIHETFDRIREALPDLVIENCSSGGHRMEPSMMQRTAMSSFSDAHESWNIPWIGRQLHYLIPPRQSQIWAVLYPDDSAERMMYSLTATFYGRMCLSGPVHDLSDAQIAVTKQAIDFYAELAPIIKSGRTEFLGHTQTNWNHLKAWSGIWRENDAGDRSMLLVHSYEGISEDTIQVTLPESACRRLIGRLEDGTTEGAVLKGNVLTIPTGQAYRGHAYLFEA